MATAASTGASLFLAELEAAMVAAAGTTEGVRLINAMKDYLGSLGQDLMSKFASVGMEAYGQFSSVTQQSVGAGIAAEQKTVLAVTAAEHSMVSHISELFQKPVPPTA